MMRMLPLFRIMALAICGSGLAAVPAFADPVEMPSRKPGLWELKLDKAGAQTIRR